MHTHLRHAQPSHAAPPAERLVELNRGDRLAICECRYSGSEWDVRLVVQGELWYQERCTTWKQVTGTTERWAQTLCTKGWRPRV
jgi:hypothetical protein